MAIEFLVPLFASILQGAIGHGLAANQASKERQEQIDMARRRREDLQPIIDRLRQAGDFFDMEEQLARDLGRASSQIDATAAQTGMTNAGSGGADNIRADLLGSMIAELAQFKQQDEMQRTAMLADILGDPTLQLGSLKDSNVGADSLWGTLLGGVSGAGSMLSALLGSEAGIEFLKGSLGKKDKPITLNIDGATARVMDSPSRQLGSGAGALVQSSPGRQLSSDGMTTRLLGGNLPEYYGIGMVGSPRPW